MGREIISNTKKAKKISSKILTLSYPKIRLVVFMVVLGLLRFLPFEVIAKSKNFSICSKILGEYCYSVGITRGVSLLLRGEFQRAIEYNALSIPVLLILIGFVLYDAYNLFKAKINK